MSLKTRLRIAIVALVTVVVVALSAVYLRDFTVIAIGSASKRVDLVEDVVKAYVLERINSGVQARGLPPSTLAELKPVWTEIVQTDPLIQNMLERTVANADVLVNLYISSEDGKTLAASSSEMVGKVIPSQDMRAVETGNAFVNLWDLLKSREDYTKTITLGVRQQPIFRITAVIRSTLLFSAIRTTFGNLAIAFLISLGIAILLAFLLPGLVLNPLDRLGRRIDMIRAGEGDPSTERNREEAQEFAAVQSKLNLLGQQFRGAKQDAMALRSNIEEMLQRLEEAVLLFDPSGQLIMAGRPVERLLGLRPAQMVGRRMDELFPESSILGAAINKARQRQGALRDQVVSIPTGTGSIRVMVNVDVLRTGSGRDEIGTLVTLRDAETRRQLERQLDVSSRLAAISRLTGGVAHEIKNPLNAMALHLEVLKSKLDVADPEIAVISSEIKRLDRVVKTFLNFNKPIDLQAKPLDVTELCLQVVQLIEPEATSKGVAVECRLGGPRWINGDEDLLQQALLNVVMNAIEAMAPGGRLVIATGEQEDEHLISVRDDGPGIPLEIQDKIFNLYFTTKKSGSGIGLAMAFRVIQLHSGTLDFSSEAGKGTVFRLRFPALSLLETSKLVSGAANG